MRKILFSGGEALPCLRGRIPHICGSVITAEGLPGAAPRCLVVNILPPCESAAELSKPQRNSVCHTRAKAQFLPPSRSRMNPEPKKARGLTAPAESKKSQELCIQMERTP